MNPSHRLIRYGMIGGGLGSFIGPVHRAALQLIGSHIRLVAGNFSSRPEVQDETASKLGLSKSRSYYHLQQMIDEELKLPPSERLDFVTIVTPNHLHFSAAKGFLEKGIPVFCEKPLTRTTAEAEELLVIQKKTGGLFGVMYGYTGYPMVKEIRRLIRDGYLGKLRKVYIEYSQGWLSDPIEQNGQKQASWRTSPEESGASLSLGDIGSHCENLLSYATGLKIEELSGLLNTYVPGRVLDDDAMVMLKLSEGVSGILCASQILTGELNSLDLRIYGDKAGLRWNQQQPERVILLEKDGTQRILNRGIPSLSKMATITSYLPSGHPEGLIEAFSNHYRGFINQILDRENREIDFPSLEQGVRGMQFIEKVVESSKLGSKWVKGPNL